MHFIPLFKALEDLREIFDGMIHITTPLKLAGINNKGPSP
jgi:hypothetical protein